MPACALPHLSAVSAQAGTARQLVTGTQAAGGIGLSRKLRKGGNNPSKGLTLGKDKRFLETILKILRITYC